jgi:peptidoglycan/xylan/chitin deacetylase (PgdA/CDA1 family)
MTAAIPILLYHSVPRDARDVTDPFAVALEQFASHLDTIVDSGRVPLTITEIAAGLRRQRPLPDQPVAITFDDGYDNTPDAIELLRKRDLRATVYVTTGQIGARSMIGHDQLKLLAELPDVVELGAHSVTHPALDELNPADIESEVSNSKRQLEQLLGREVRSFAYPHGAYDRRTRAIVIAAGFESAAAVKNAISHPGDDPWAIARWTVRSTTDARQIARVMDGRGAPRAWARERLRTSGYRGVRRLRRRLGRRVQS